MSFTGSFTEDEQHLLAPLFLLRGHKNIDKIDCSVLAHRATVCPRKAFLLKEAVRLNLTYLYTLSVTQRSFSICSEGRNRSVTRRIVLSMMDLIECVTSDNGFAFFTLNCHLVSCITNLNAELRLLFLPTGMLYYQCEY